MTQRQDEGSSTLDRSEQEVPAFDTVLFDVDGTLIDSTYHHALAWSRAFARYDLAPELWRVHRSIGMGGDRLVPALVGDNVEEAKGDALREAWGEEYGKIVDEVVAFTGAAEAIRGIQELGYRVAIASSGKKEFTDVALERLGITRDDVAAVTSSDDAGAGKPEPDILHAALESAGGQHGLLIGDATWDVISAHRAGMGCIGVRTGGFSAAELKDEGALAVLEHVADVVSHPLLAR